MKKLLAIIILIILVCVFYFWGTLIFQNTIAFFSGKPPVVRLFACSDNCPQPASQYYTWVYKGVTTAEKCSEIDGVFSSVTGWTTFYFCKVR